MLKTNSKKVEEKIKNYLIEEISQYEEEENDFQKGLDLIINYFNDNNKWDYIGENNVISFLRNTCTLFPIYYSEMRELLKNWLEETEEESKKYSNDKVQTLFDNLLERILFKYFNLHKTIKYNFRNIQYSRSYLVIERN